jgi:hypothetical protein
MFFSIKDYKKALQENIKTKLEQYHDRTGEWSFAKAEKEFNSRFKCLKYLPEFRKDAITKTQIKYADIKNMLKSKVFAAFIGCLIYFGNCFVMLNLSGVTLKFYRIGKQFLGYNFTLYFRNISQRCLQQRRTA